MRALDCMHLTTSGHAPDDSADGALQGQTLDQGIKELPCKVRHKDTLQLLLQRLKRSYSFSLWFVNTSIVRQVANMHWYDEAGQSPRTVRTDLPVRKSVSDSLIRNMHTSRQPEMIFRALQCSYLLPPHTEGADTGPAAGHASIILFHSLLMVLLVCYP